jgi:cyanate permease
MEQLITMALSYLPVVLGGVVVPVLGKLKKKINKDRPIIWGLLSVLTSIGVYLGAANGIEAATDEQVVNELNVALTPVFTQLVHSFFKDRKKVNGK